MLKKRILYAAVLFLGVSLLLPGKRIAEGKDFPSRPVEIIIAFGPGGTSDLTVRLMANELSRALGVPVILTNKGGGSGAVGSEYVAKAKPDGYTILLNSGQSFTILPIVNPDIHFKLSDYTTLCRYVVSDQVIFVRKDSAYKSFADIVADAKKRPGQVTVATIGAGTQSQFIVDLMKLHARIDISVLPYKGGGELIVSVMGGQVGFGIQGLSPLLALLKSGDLRALASTTGNKRIKGFPSVPTMGESGYPEVSLPSYSYGYFLPKNTPKPIVDKLAAAFEKVIKSPSLEKKLESAGVFPAYQDSAAFHKHLIEERKLMESVARKTNFIK